MSRPGRANGALLPAACAAALLALAGLQLALTGDVALPADSWSGGGMRAAMPRIAAGPASEDLRADSIFSPLRTAGGDESAAPSQLGGVVVVGSVSVRGRSYAVIRRADGSVERLRPGESVDGLRLVALSAEGAVFKKDGQRIDAPFGQTAITPAADGAAYEDQDQ